MSWSKYIVQKKQEYSGGMWIDVIPLETRRGEKIGDYSTFEECNSFNGKFRAYYSNGTTYSAECDSSTALTSGETRPNGYEYSAMTSAIIGDCVASIGPWAFGNEFNKFSGLTNVTMADSVISIGKFAFTDCINLKNITLSNNLVSIDDGAFELCDFTNISLPDTLISIGEMAFLMCPSLSNITIPDSVTTIGETCFYACSGLTSVTIGSGITEIGDNAFNYCSGLTSITVNAVTPPALNGYVQGQETQAFNFTNNAPIYVPCSSVNVYKSASGWSKYASRIQEIPGSCTEPTYDGKFKATYEGGSIYELACNGNSTLTSGETQPSGYQYSAMTSAIIGGCTTQIGVMAFYNYRKLSGVTIPNTVTRIRDTAFASCSSLSAITIPNSVTAIDFNAFGYCTGLLSITIPDSVTTIGNAAFSNCRSLTSVTIGSGLTTIGSAFLQACSGVTSVVIPDSVTTIGTSMCSGCTGLLDITIGSGITSIGNEALFSCINLESVTMKATTPPTLGTAFVRTNNTFMIYVPSGSVNTYKSASGWSDYSSRIIAISS